MAEDNAPRSVADALAEVTRRQGEEESRHQAELTEVDQEVESLKTAMANLQQQLEALAKFREELVAKLESVSGGVHKRSYDAIFGALREQAQALSGRAAKVAYAQQARDADFSEALEDEEVKSLLADHQQFTQVVAPTLESLPSSYRVALENRHSEITEQLRDALGDQVGAAIEVQEELLGIDVLLALDAHEGVTEVIMLVLPVVEQVQTAWDEREEDLQTWVGVRVMQAVYGVCQRIGLLGAQGMYGGHQGLLAVELELGGGDPDDVRTKLKEAIDQVFAEAPELIGAKVSSRVMAVEVDHLFPPGTEEEE
ncbi:MAG: hypothetical protein JRJ84_12555, partial [Deltaproteobacteria bacterium]|nr:hypothetical protein [Deltaproteobacteria bacterium]